MEDNLSWLYMPVDSVPTPPVSTRVQLLPFSELDWKNFEKLCYRLVRLEANVEFSQLYGTQGSSQEGIDIYARLSTSEKYRVYQCKNEQDFGPAKIDTAVDVFFEGEWLQKSEQFILCTRESLRSTTARSNAVEKQASILKEFGVSLLCWDEEELSSRLKSQPEIVDDFFGRAWVKAFCGEEEANKLNNRLNITEVNILRSRLLSLYERVFNKHDRGIPLSDTLPISQRYIIPDIEDFQTLSPVLETEFVQAKQDISDSNSTLDASKPLSITSRGTTRRYIQRLPIQNWITKSKKSLLLGDPGSGKSTFLRFLSMDLLKDCPSLTTVVEKWGGYLPLWIPFAIWTKIIKEGNVSERSVKGVLSCWLKSWDEEDLVPLIENALKDKRLLLLVDGLDEHSDVESAKVALTHLETFLAANDIAVIAITRPNGFEKLEIKTDSWQKARIAGLSQDQQKELVKIWFTASSHKMNPSLGEATRLKDVEREIDIFFGELSRSNELKELAHNALLLSLLISFQISHIRLPLGRFKVYQELTNHLILTHPEIRRLSAGVTSEQSLNENDLKKTLAHLANIIHEQYPEGIIKEDEALKVLVDFLMDDVQGLGMSRYIATETGRNILTRAEDQLGIIVKKTQDEIGFYHRTIQEYLVSFCIARFSLDKQKSIVAQRCTDHMWKDVILGLFQITNSPQDVSSIIESIPIKKLSQLEKRNVFELLSEIVFGDYNCPPNLAREISKDIFTQIELETFNPYREKLLKHVLNGLRSSIMSDVVKEKIQSWFPNRTGWSTSYIFSEMSNWNRGVDLLECLFKALHAEEYVTKQRAAITLAKLWKGDLEVYKKLVDLVNYSEDPYVVSAVVECLTLGWNSEPELLSIFKRLSKSLSPTLRLVVIKGRVSLNIHDDVDLDNIIKLARTGGDFFLYNEEIIDIILKGWPKSERIKKLCLMSLDRLNDEEVNIDRGIALKLLFKGYPMDEDIADFCVRELEQEQYPFSSHRYELFEIFAANFRGHQKIIVALDKWIQNTKFADVEASYAAQVGRTPTFKARLIKDLKNSFPHWPARGLLQGWGMKDSEVSSCLLGLVKGSADVASQFGHLIPQIIVDKDSCRNRLIEILKDTNCVRYDFVIQGLVELGITSNDTDVVDIVLPILENNLDGQYVDALTSEIIKYYSFDTRIKNLAIKILGERDAPYQSVAHSFGNDPEIRSLLLKICNPLPTALRQTISVYLSEAEVEEKFARLVLSLYDHEVDKEVKVQSAIGYYTRLRLVGGEDIDVSLQILKKVIACGGPDHVERRFAAFCGLTILDRLDIMQDVKEKYGAEGSPVALDTIEGHDLNIPYLRFLLKNWKSIKIYFKDEFWTRIFRYGLTDHTWNKLAQLGDEYPEPSQEILKFLSTQNPKIAESETLLFLSRVLPSSDILLEYCLGTLFSPHDRIVPRRTSSNMISYRDELVAAEVLADNFGGDEQILKMVNTETNKIHNINELVILLTEGWSGSPELERLFQELKQSKRKVAESVIIRYWCLNANVVNAYKQIIKLIRSCSWRSKYDVRYEEFIKPLIRRLQRDDRLVGVLIKYLHICDNPSEKISISKLTFRARGLTPDLRKWAENELILQFDGRGIEIGIDITSLELTSVSQSIYEIVNNN